MIDGVAAFELVAEHARRARACRRRSLAFRRGTNGWRSSSHEARHFEGLVIAHAEAIIRDAEKKQENDES